MHRTIRLSRDPQGALWVSIGDSPDSLFSLNDPAELGSSDREVIGNLTPTQKRIIIQKIHRVNQNIESSNPRGVSTIVPVVFMGLVALASIGQNGTTAPAAAPSQCSLGGSEYVTPANANISETTYKINGPRGSLDELRRINGELQEVLNKRSGNSDGPSIPTQSPQETTYEFGY